MINSSNPKQIRLDRIAASIEKDNICQALAAGATQMVFGAGNSNSEILFVGEAPGKREDLLGVPFVGAAGKFLQVMLASIGLEREDVYITNIVKYRPPENRDPTPAEIAEFIPYLKRQIRVISPKLVVFLGRHSARVFFPKLTIGEAHGVPIRLRGQMYLPLYHPAAALYNPGQRQVLLEDFSKIPDILKNC